MFQDHSTAINRIGTLNRDFIYDDFMRINKDIFLLSSEFGDLVDIRMNNFAKNDETFELSSLFYGV